MFLALMRPGTPRYWMPLGEKMVAPASNQATWLVPSSSSGTTIPVQAHMQSLNCMYLKLSRQRGRLLKLTCPNINNLLFMFYSDCFCLVYFITPLYKSFSCIRPTPLDVTQLALSSTKIKSFRKGHQIRPTPCNVLSNPSSPVLLDVTMTLRERGAHQGHRAWPSGRG